MSSAIQAANVGCLMPHCAAKAGALSELESKAARTCSLYRHLIASAAGVIGVDDVASG